MKQAVISLLFTMLLPAMTFAAPVDEAKALFDRYVQLEHAFDPATADLYADDAVIKNKRTYPAAT